MQTRDVSPEETLSWAEGAAVLVALGLDLLGEPPAAWHPIVWFGKFIRFLERALLEERRVARLLYGTAMLLFAIPVGTLWSTAKATYIE